jgi:hypothetical protein
MKKNILNAHRGTYKVPTMLLRHFFSKTEKFRTLTISLLIHFLILLLLSPLIMREVRDERRVQAYAEEPQVVVEQITDEIVTEPDPLPNSEVVGNSSQLEGGFSSSLPLGGATQLAAMPDFISTNTLASFQLPSSTGSALAVKGSGSKGSGGGSGSGRGDGSGMGRLGGLIVGAGGLVVVLDISGSMTEYNKSLRDQIQRKFPEASVVESASARGADYDFSPRENVFSQDDLYSATYRALVGKPLTESVYLLSDFADGEDIKATEKFIATLKERGIKLYLCYIKKKPYAKLFEYAKNTGEAEKFKLDN